MMSHIEMEEYNNWSIDDLLKRHEELFNLYIASSLGSVWEEYLLVSQILEYRGIYCPELHDRAV